MNWRNPFLVTYLAVTVAGTAILGYLVYAAWTQAQEADANYIAAVNKLHQLQNRSPFPSDANNDKYIQYTKDYRAEYERLIAKAAVMQKPLEAISPQDFQDRLRANVSQVQQAAKENGVTLPDGFYLGFDKYQGILPSESAAAPLARELAAIRIIIDQLILVKVREITGIVRTALPEEVGTPVAAQPTPANNSRSAATNRPGNTRNNRPGAPQPMSNVVLSNNFEVLFVADQAATRGALNFIANSDQFFIIRYLNIENSATEGPLRGEAAAAASPPPPDPSLPPDASAPAAPGVNVLVGLETLKVALRIEMITFNNLPDLK